MRTKIQSFESPLAQTAYQKAASLSIALKPAIQTSTARTADKFPLRCSKSLCDELSDIGYSRGRSQNVEFVVAITEALDGFCRTESMIKILKAHLGEAKSQKALSRVVTFRDADDPVRAQHILRCHATMRDMIRTESQKPTYVPTDGRRASMNSWIIEAVEHWINQERQLIALLDASLN